MKNSETRISKLEGKVVALEENINSLITITKSSHELLTTIAKFSDDNFEKIEERLDGMQKTLNTLSKKTSSGFEDVSTQLSSIEGELKKINTATGYEEQYNNLRIVAGD